MDPLSHTLIGALGAKSVHANKRRFWIMAILGMVPDLDVLLGGLGSWAFIFQHRGMSHSLIGLVIQAIFFAFILARWDPGSFKLRALHYALPIGVHILSDYLTCFGVPFFSPFSTKEYSLDLVGSVNILPVLVTLAALVWLHRSERSGWKATRLIWAMWGLYLLVFISGKGYAGKILGNPSINAMPTTFSTFTWRTVEEVDPSHYQTRMVDLLNKSSGQISLLAKPGNAFPVQASLASPKVQKFLSENRWPMVQFSQKGDSWVVDWGTLLFSTRGLVRGKVRVEVSSTGEILSEKKIFTFWDPKPVS